MDLIASQFPEFPGYSFWFPGKFSTKNFTFPGGVFPAWGAWRSEGDPDGSQTIWSGRKAAHFGLRTPGTRRVSRRFGVIWSPRKRRKWAFTAETPQIIKLRKCSLPRTRRRELEKLFWKPPINWLSKKFLLGSSNTLKLLGTNMIKTKSTSLSSDFLRSTQNFKKSSLWFVHLLSKAQWGRFFSNYVCFSESPNFTISQSSFVYYVCITVPCRI